MQHGTSYAQALGPSLANWDAFCFSRLVGAMQHDRLNVEHPEPFKL
jgi:hypothetical protein